MQQRKDDDVQGSDSEIQISNVATKSDKVNILNQSKPRITPGLGGFCIQRSRSEVSQSRPTTITISNRGKSLLDIPAAFALGNQGGPEDSSLPFQYPRPTTAFITQNDFATGDSLQDIDDASVRSFAPTVRTVTGAESMLGNILDHDLDKHLTPMTLDRRNSFRSLRSTKSMRSLRSLAIHDTSDTFSITSEDSLAISEDLGDEERIQMWFKRKKHFLILSSAGKPIYSRFGDESLSMAYMGVLQTIISFFLEDRDPLKSFVAGDTRFFVSLEGPLYFVAISSLGETDYQLQVQLDILHNQILSTLTLAQLSRAFENRDNFDLRMLLGGTEVFLDGLSDAMIRGDFPVMLSAIECLKIRRRERLRIDSALLEAKHPNLLYGLLVVDGRLVSVIRPRKHSLHPLDLQLIFSMLFNSTTFNEGGEYWIPICLPKFDSTGFLHMYVSFIANKVGLVLLSAGKEEFFSMREVKENIVDQLQRKGLLHILKNTIEKGRLVDIQIPRLQHFLYKSKDLVQFTMPSLPAALEEPRNLHTKSALTKIHCLRTPFAVTVAWVTPLFEMYCVANPQISTNSLVKSANHVVKWIGKEEGRLFIHGGAVF
ncbi:Vacuolar fusion protein MON1 [Neolecta irregularis DAH-3]|uniref:Vacuolar fusion protein MON1 n=1 Tax=Neolecta irregularis (strain DAH-3) TaxID=1198029 RepID=A0A1U7LRU0_NEOID|nr:Vacuolar fusion protein MON1 [Neolecta irregularis DAH-3]|eukprot:OLL25390.1 Vacuolar fusion protein MON1 [Neolecta irregularis DAH-3]